ncbi:MAG: cyclic nucleotide-binding domain-containing protein [Chloroflexi bacterium]|nr:cyclic nucleotide-binding domain-containing protein [Chloroflexota bacterium]
MADMSLPETAASLGRARLFERAGAEDLAALAAAAAVRAFAPGEVLARAGEPAEALLVIVEGRVAVEAAPEGDTLPGVSVALDPGDSLGELAVLDGAAHAATAIARMPTTALWLPRAALLAAVRASPELAVALLATLAGWARRADRRAAELALRGAGAPPFAFRRLHAAPGEPADVAEG